MDVSRLLLTAEKRAAVEQSDIKSAAVVNLLTCQFDKVYTQQEGDQGREYLPLNYLHRVWVALNLKLKNDVKAWDCLEQFVDGWLCLEPLESQQFSQEELLLMSMNSLGGVFLKENWTGKSYLFTNAEIWYQEERVMKSDPEAMQAYAEKMSNLSYNDLPEIYQKLAGCLNVGQSDFDGATFAVYKDKEFVKACNPSVFSEYMVLNGEECYRTLKLIHFYLIARKIAEMLIEKGSAERHYYLYLFRARLAFLHAQVVSYPTEGLREVMMSNYEKLIQKMDSNPGLIDPENTALIYIEFAQAVLHFFKYSLCEEYLEKAKKILGIEFSFTGKLGVRTKYQEFKVSQLTLEIEKDTTLTSQMTDNVEGDVTLPKIIALEDIIDNILYEKPMIEHQSEKKELSVYDHILVIAIIRHIQKTSPMDDVLREQVLAYIHQTQHKVKNWSVLVMTLLVRSLTEFNFQKKRERSLLQLHQISDEWNLGKEDSYERQKYLFPLNFPSYIEYQTMIIEKYINMGMVMTACQIYERLEMFEECVECFYMAGHLDKAKELAEKLMKEKPTPKLYCTLGDVQKDPTMYVKAWELSGERYARAQRSLGKHYYNQKQFDKAIEHLKKAVELNDYHMDSWSLLGFIYMNTQKFTEAINCYSKVVQIDSGQSFCWANMANLYMVTGKKAEALLTIEQAAKLNDSRWKIWLNYASIAYENQKFSKFLKAILKVIDLDKAEAIDDNSVKRLVVAMNMTIESVMKKPEEIRMAELIYKDVMAAFNRLLNKMPQRHAVWKLYSDFLHFDFALYSIKHGIRQLDLEKTKVFMIEEPTIPVEEYRKDRVAKRFEATLKECHSIMKIGWEADVEANQLIYDATLRLIEYSKVLADAQVNTQLDIHLSATKAILKQCIGDKVDLSKLSLETVN